MKAIVVTAADEAYAALAEGLLDSLEPHRAALGLDVGILDLGLSIQSREKLSERGVHILVPPWPFRPHALFDGDLKWRARASRPFLRDLFPGYDAYLWFDADTFVQERRGLEWLLRTGNAESTAVVPAVDRSYTHHPRQVEWIRQRYVMGFGAEVADRLMALPYINSGVFAFGARAPVWARFAKRFQDALDRWDGKFLSDQAVLNATLVLDEVPHVRLPSLCNWICHLALPRWQSERRRFVEASFPFTPIFIVHNTPVDKNAVYKLMDERGRPHETRLAFSSLNR
ncbi:MAG TPA: hypothetical protein VF943_09745 [Burkholderiales bacterium]